MTKTAVAKSVPAAKLISAQRVRCDSVIAITKRAPAPALAYRVEADGRSVVYATDTEDPFSGNENPVVALAKDADVLIHDAQYDDDDYKKGWGHSTIATAVDVAVRAGVKRLVLYHHDPDRSDDMLDKVGADAQRLARERGSTAEVLVAYEGMELEV